MTMLKIKRNYFFMACQIIRLPLAQALINLICICKSYDFGGNSLTKTKIEDYQLL